jgi:alkyl hydroperoxide reductase subunit AhpC
MKATVGKKAPAFKTVAWDNGVKVIELEQYKGKWVVLFFYPFDFTFVCPTEIINFSDAAETFKKLNTEVLGCSIDSHFVHSEWCKKPRKEGGLGNMQIPLLADVSK